MSFFRRLGRAAAHDGGADGVQDAGGEGPLGPLRRVLAQLVPHPLQRLDRRLRRAPRRVSSEGRSARDGQQARPAGPRTRLALARHCRARRGGGLGRTRLPLLRFAGHRIGPLPSIRR